MSQEKNTCNGCGFVHTLCSCLPLVFQKPEKKIPPEARLLALKMHETINESKNQPINTKIALKELWFIAYNGNEKLNHLTA